MKEITPEKNPALDGNFIDKIVRYVNPGAAAKRMHARFAMDTADTFYRGASRRRHGMKNWTIKVGDPDQKMGDDLHYLRERSFDLYGNSPLATGAINTNCTNIIGSGLKLQPSIDRRVLSSLSDTQADDLETLIDIQFETWSSDPLHFDISGIHNISETALIAFRSTLLAGDTFVNMPFLRRKGSPFGLKVQLIDGARVSNPNHRGNSLAMVAGIEKDGHGKPIIYHILNMHPDRYDGKIERKWDKFPVFGTKTGRRNVLHLANIKHIGQTRGIPYLSPVIETLKKLDEYTEAEVTAAVVSALFTVFITKEGNAGSPLIMGNDKKDDDDEVKMGSGSVVELQKGEEASFADPKRPNTAFDPFVQAVLRQVGVALEIPFEILIKHFTSSYSAARASILEAWRYFMARRKWLADNFYAPIYENWMEEMIVNGIITAPGFFDDPVIRKAYLGANWKGPARGHIDEKKEIEAAEKRMALGISTAYQETAEINGGNWRKNVAQIKKENQLREEAGLSIPSLKGSGNSNKIEEQENEDK